MNDSLRAARRREEGWAYLMLAPYLLAFLLFLVYPSLQGLYLSFTDWTMLTAPVWVGIDNYRAVLHDQEFRTALFNTAGMGTENRAR